MAGSAHAGVMAPSPETPAIALFHAPGAPVAELVAALAARGVTLQDASGPWDERAQGAIDRARRVLIAVGAEGLDRATEDAAHYAAQQQNAGFLVGLLVVTLPGAGPGAPRALGSATHVDLSAGLGEDGLSRLADRALGRGGKERPNEMALPALLEGSKNFTFPELPWGLILTVVVTLVIALVMVWSD